MELEDDTVLPVFGVITVDGSLRLGELWHLSLVRLYRRADWKRVWCLCLGCET